MAKKAKRGRPCKVNWSRFNLQWRVKTNSEIAHEAGCTVMNVHNRRKLLVKSAEVAGKDPEFYKFKGSPYTRSRYLKKVVETHSEN